MDKVIMEVVERVICGYGYSNNGGGGMNNIMRLWIYSCEVEERLMNMVVQYNYGGGESIFLCWNMDLR